MKSLNFRGGFTTKQYLGGKLPKKGTRTICRCERGLGKKDVVVFLIVVDTPIHTRFMVIGTVMSLYVATVLFLNISLVFYLWTRLLGALSQVQILWNCLTLFSVKNSLSFRKARFASFNNTNFNSSKKRGLKWFLKDLLPVVTWLVGITTRLSSVTTTCYQILPVCFN